MYRSCKEKTHRYYVLLMCSYIYVRDRKRGTKQLKNDFFFVVFYLTFGRKKKTGIMRLTGW